MRTKGLRRDHQHKHYHFEDDYYADVQCINLKSCSKHVPYSPMVCLDAFVIICMFFFSFYLLLRGKWFVHTFVCLFYLGMRTVNSQILPDMRLYIVPPAIINSFEIENYCVFL